ncbi:MAG: peptidylprolyl isomerase [Bradyrhizobiaceae bacterium]|nr:peptidylprolyl isomerase [Bradyrhizobiaceae bacterium]
MLHFRLALLCLSAALLVSPLPAQQSKTANLDNEVLATVGGEKVLYRDVERAFQKNLTRRDTKLSSVARDTALDFLHLYTNYRLKVADAIDRGIANDEAVQADIANNRKLLSETWYLDKAFANARIDELAHRRMEEVKLSLILCAVTNAGASKWDSVRSLNKANAIIDALSKGADFAQLARDSSDDKETGNNGGEIPWISGGSIIKSVEDAAYSQPIGSFSKKPIETRFGYFIIKVTDRAPREVVKFRHILIRAKEHRDSAASELFADSLLAILHAKPAQQQRMLAARGLTTTGDVFEDLAKAYSDDEASGSKGGYLGAPYSRSSGLESNNARLIPAFESAVFKLKDNDISGKVRTIYGIHIIRRDSTRIPDAIAERDNAKKTYKRLYFEEDKRNHYDSLKTAWGYRWDQPTYTQLMESIDTTRNTSDATWSAKLEPALLDKALFTYPGNRITVSAFVDSLHRRKDFQGYTLNRAGMERAMNKIIDPILLEQATKNLDKTDLDFAALMREFNDGILLFKVEEQEVWSKLKFDTADAQRFFDTTRSRWMTDTRYVVSEIYLLSDSAVNNIQGQLLKGADFAALAREHTQRQGMRERDGKYGPASPKTSVLAKYAEEHHMKPGDVSSPFKADKGTAIIRLESIEPPRMKTFEEATSELAPAYQDQLQKKLTEQWLSGVRAKHPVVINTKVIDAIWSARPVQAKTKKPSRK